MTILSYKLQARHTTGLTPRLQQAVKLLQMSALDCSQEVTQAMALNPFLEELADAEIESNPPDERVSSFDPPEMRSARTNEDPAVEFTQYEAVEPSPSYSGDYPVSNKHSREDDGASDVGAWAHRPPTLHDSLRANLCGAKINPRNAWLIDLIIDSLDEDGYLRTPFSELTDSHQPGPAPSDHEWKAALLMVQQLGAPGVGARDLVECLSLQLRARPVDQPGRELALRIVTEALDQLGRCDYPGLVRSMACTDADMKEACALIRHLDPRPGASFIPPDPACYIVADVLVRRIGKRWVALPNGDAAPRVRVNGAYAQMFCESHYSDRNLMARALQEARWLVHNLAQRDATIQRVAQAIVARQQTFFDYGAIALRPLMLSEVAQQLNLHESTISRATSCKYLASPLGIFEFKYFFSRELATRSGGTCSAAAVRALIKEMIDQENPYVPLSDVELASKLSHEGVVVARRTVSKYRAQIKYPAAELRRTMS